MELAEMYLPGFAGDQSIGSDLTVKHAHRVAVATLDTNAENGQVAFAIAIQRAVDTGEGVLRPAALQLAAVVRDEGRGVGLVLTELL